MNTTLVLVTYGHGSGLVWWHCNNLCISGFVDDVILCIHHILKLTALDWDGIWYLWLLRFCWNLSADGVLSSGKLSSLKQKSPVSMTSATTMSQLLKTLFGGIYDSRVNFDNVVYDDLGIWTPDWVHMFHSILCYIVITNCISKAGNKISRFQLSVSTQTFEPPAFWPWFLHVYGSCPQFAGDWK